MRLDVSRRRFLATAAAGVACSPAASVGPATAVPGPPSPSAQPRGEDPPRLLMLGGTGFLGPHLVRRAQARGFTVTLFNRGKTDPHLFEQLEQLRGDRNDDLRALQGRRFEVVLDTSGYFPRQVEATARLLGPTAQQYVFVSSISVYRSFGEIGIDESAPTAPMPDPYSEEMPTHYGALKAGCERAAEAAMPGRTTVIRPGLIVGPGDPTDRFTYWPARIARGGDVLAPGRPEDRVQFIDVEDLADWMVELSWRRTMGTFNATGPRDATSIGELLATCTQVSGSDARLRWASTEFLTAHEVAPWMQMPVWVPPEDPEFKGFAQIDTQRARASGLTFRPVADTVARTLAWWNAQPEDRRSKLRAGLDAERETALLAEL